MSRRYRNPYLVLKNGFNNGRRYNIRGLYCLLNLKKTTASDFGEVEVNGILYTLNGEILTDLVNYQSQRNKQKDEFLESQELLEQKV
ncbi:MAG: hypothetical protein AABY07_08955 [Nanoarchaeota archaeon]